MGNSYTLLSIAVSFILVFGYGLNAQAQAPKTITNSIGMKLVLIPKGTFLMGSPLTEKDSEYSMPHHEVTLTKNFYLGSFEVTQAQYEKVMTSNPSWFQGNRVAKRHPETRRVIGDMDSSNYPVECVSWEDAVKFCERLSELPEEKKAGRVYRLPTEAEWEYACRAGSKTAFSFDDKIQSVDDYIWHSGNSNNQTNPVGRKKPNAWGLHDMHGNVWEWCSDDFSDYPKGAVIDPAGSSKGSIRVLRGGGWNLKAVICRSSLRGASSISDCNNGIGFRIVMNSSEILK